ncbi:HPr kinase/phosphatase C-terminal domain-containing protein [Brevundimonas sp.]|uniref:HPr kinase/phosphorylase n=1 Tax=Brevundimonas sp. TaxID=1871086 RepID=UPI00286B9AE0|nr:HPr kinase/phosphatase C-terminal domain-containing protein [Brevundimonas sp.]
MTQPIHATAVARYGPAGWRAVLLRGPSGSGKSDMALRLIDAGWRLVADDYAHVWASGDGLHACAPERIAGRIEARGLGVLDAATRPAARVCLLVDCVQATPERLPEPAFEIVADVGLPRLVLDIRPASAIQTLALAIDRL